MVQALENKTTDEQYIRLAESIFSTIDFNKYVNKSIQSPDLLDLDIDLGVANLKVCAIIKKESCYKSTRNFYDDSCTGLVRYCSIKRIEIVDNYIATPHKVIKFSGYRLLAALDELNYNNAN